MSKTQKNVVFGTTKAKAKKAKAKTTKGEAKAPAVRRLVPKPPVTESPLMVAPVKPQRFDTVRAGIGPSKPIRDYKFYLISGLSGSPLDDNGVPDPGGLYRLERFNFRKPPFNNNRVYRDGLVQDLKAGKRLNDMSFNLPIRKENIDNEVCRLAQYLYDGDCLYDNDGYSYDGCCRFFLVNDSMRDGNRSGNIYVPILDGDGSDTGRIMSIPDITGQIDVDTDHSWYYLYLNPSYTQYSWVVVTPLELC